MMGIWRMCDPQLQIQNVQNFDFEVMCFKNPKNSFELLTEQKLIPQLLRLIWTILFTALLMRDGEQIFITSNNYLKSHDK